ncbi:MAG: nuclear transport factor 2 family protein [Gammaproteobacteria bacterium]|nr:MAG: nuclear transport factor 2 family protein [Gammaproteobacteria bacterium]
MTAAAELRAMGERLARLEARVAITELLARYGRALDEWNEDDMRALIAADVVARHDAVAPPFTGVETLINVMRALRPKVQAVQHFITNAHVEPGPDGDHAVARAFVFAVHDTGVAQGGKLLQAGGAYRMEVGRADNIVGWQIRTIEVTETWLDPRLLTDLYTDSPMSQHGA